MKPTEVLFKTAPLKKFTNYRDLGFKYKVVRIPALKDEVKSRQQKTESATCVNEMSRMMDCWKRTDFNQKACSSETEVFMQCVAAAQAESKEARERAARGLPVKGSNFRPSKQVNEMLAQYPQPASNLK